MFDLKDTAGETAISYADQFFDAAVKKIDKAFGKGFGRENPALVGAYVAACASNLLTFIQSAVAATKLEELLEDAEANDLFADDEPEPQRS